MTEEKSFLQSFQKIVKPIHWFEDGILFFALLVMILLSFTQIVMRNLFSSGYVWADAALRYLVLWVGMLGAMVATRLDNHITIDMVARYAPLRWKAAIRVVTDAAVIAATGVMTYASVDFIKEELTAGSKAFAEVPTWAAEIILPIAFSVICLRYIFFLCVHAYEAATGKIILKQAVEK
jgi:TRAP-type C4-dicarboxylate transport system permease small subunit